jgi:hypothetical protein
LSNSSENAGTHLSEVPSLIPESDHGRPWKQLPNSFIGSVQLQLCLCSVSCRRRLRE